MIALDTSKEEGDEYFLILKRFKIEVKRVVTLCNNQNMKMTHIPRTLKQYYNFISCMDTSHGDYAALPALQDFINKKCYFRSLLRVLL